jgi:6-phosphogluconolactonase (cycloisomerase 2 family)
VEPSPLSFTDDPNGEKVPSWDGYPRVDFYMQALYQVVKTIAKHVGRIWGVQQFIKHLARGPRPSRAEKNHVHAG